MKIQCISDAYKGSPVDLAVLCDNLCKIPVALHAEVIDMFISHLNIPQDGSALSSVQLKLVDQSLRGIRVLLGSGHTPSAPVDTCSCRFTLASNWPRILDCAEYILDADFDGTCMGHDHLEKQISAVLYTATRVDRLVEHIHGPFGQRTACIASRLLMRQDKHAAAPWSNEETIISLHSCDDNTETLAHLLETFSDDLSQIIDMLTTRLRVFSKETLSAESVVHIKDILYLTGELINEYGSRWRARENVNMYAVIAKSLLSIATALNAPANRNDKVFRSRATIAIIFGLMLYTDISGYCDLQVAIAIVRLGLFDVLLVVHAPLVQLVEPKKRLSKLVDPVISQFLPEFLLYGSFIEVVVTALRPMVQDRRLRTLSQGPFGEAWVRFERLLLERYVIKRMWDTEAKNFNVHGVCYNVSTLYVVYDHNLVTQNTFRTHVKRGIFSRISRSAADA